MAIKHVMGRDIAVQLCNIVGLDPSLVTGITLNLEPGSIAAIEVTRILTRDEADTLVHVVEQYDFFKRAQINVDSQPDT